MCGTCKESMLKQLHPVKCRRCNTLMCHQCIRPVCAMCTCHDVPKDPKILAMEFVAGGGYPVAWNTRVVDRLEGCQLPHQCIEEGCQMELHQDCGVIHLDMDGGACRGFGPESVNCKLACQDCGCGHLCEADVYCSECTKGLAAFRATVAAKKTAQ